MSAKTKQQDMRAAKERKQKRIIAVGGVVLLVVLAIQVPRLMNNGSSEVTPATTTAADSTAADGSTAAVAATRTTATGVPATRTRLPDSDTPPQREKSQLVSFERFDSKDPFVQQVSDEVPVPTTTAPAAAASAGSTSSGATTATAAPAAPAGPTTVARTTAGTTSSSLEATIEVNGKAESVAVSDTFPKSNPTFRLVSLGGGVAMVGIADGAYASGAQTVALPAGKTLTLVDTADGVRYELRLVPAQ